MKLEHVHVLFCSMEFFFYILQPVCERCIEMNRISNAKPVEFLSIYMIKTILRAIEKKVDIIWMIDKWWYWTFQLDVGWIFFSWKQSLDEGQWPYSGFS